MDTHKHLLMEYLSKNDLLRATLLLGRIEEPNFDFAPLVERILKKAGVASSRLGKNKQDTVAIARTIHWLIFEELGISGKTEKSKQVIDDASQFYIHLALEKKKTSALCLAILYTILAQQLGLGTECLAFPSHFILKVKDLAGDFYVDPHDWGKFLTEAEFNRKFRLAMQKKHLLTSSLYELASPAQLVAKLIQHLKHVYILKNDSLKALRAVEFLTALYPESPELTRDRGVLYCEMEYFSKAVADLRFYMKKRPKADDIKEIKKLASLISGYQETVN